MYIYQGRRVTREEKRRQQRIRANLIGIGLMALLVLAGVILGAWTNCTPQVEEHNLELPEIFRELIAPAGKPAVMGLACGHVIPTLALPLGAQAALDAGEGVLEVPDDPR